MKTLIISTLLITCTLCSCQKPLDFKQKIPPTEQYLSTTGRYLEVKDGTLNFDWTGTYIQTDFTGGSIAIDIADTGNDYFNVFIDDVFTHKIFVNNPEPSRIILAKGLGSGVHRLRLQKCTEATQGCARIYGFYVVKGATMKPVPRKKRLIEFIGDSYTCAYGTEGTKTDQFKLETENCDKGYACLIAKYFDADYVLVAHSGMGVVHNYNDSVVESKGNMVERYMRTLDEDPRVFYGFSKYKPDLVVINLGTNDYGAGKEPTAEDFAVHYMVLLQNIRAHYPEVPIFCVIPHSANNLLMAAVSRLHFHLDNFQKKDELLHVYLSVPMPELITYDHDTGADYHPNNQGHRKIAMQLIPRISSIMNWPLESKNIE